LTALLWLQRSSITGCFVSLGVHPADFAVAPGSIPTMPVIHQMIG
jgi:hypothetical protein